MSQFAKLYEVILRIKGSRRAIDRAPDFHLLRWICQRNERPCLAIILALVYQLKHQTISRRLMLPSNTSSRFDCVELEKRWTHLVQEHLPALATSQDQVQASWPVELNHCFARIILDNVPSIGGGRKLWQAVVESPAIDNLTAAQLRDAVHMAENIATGLADLCALNKRSLQMRTTRGNTNDGWRTGLQGSALKRASISKHPLSKKPKPQQRPTIDLYFMRTADLISQQSVMNTSHGEGDRSQPLFSNAKPGTNCNEITRTVHLISISSLTPFRKLTLTLLCQIPEGRYATYGILAEHISQKTGRKCCARAVGNAMRNNPFAPAAPCHRVLAADGSLGGFKGSWGESGAFAADKHRLLEKEGVKFDSMGKVRGLPFQSFA